MARKKSKKAKSFKIGTLVRIPFTHSAYNSHDSGWTLSRVKALGLKQEQFNTIKLPWLRFEHRGGYQSRRDAIDASSMMYMGYCTTYKCELKHSWSSGQHRYRDEPTVTTAVQTARGHKLLIGERMYYVTTNDMRKLIDVEDEITEYVAIMRNMFGESAEDELVKSHAISAIFARDWLLKIGRK
jgi:hypothetical protein